MKGVHVMHRDVETVKLLRSIRNMVFGIGFMVFAMGLVTFGYLFAQGTTLFTVIVYVSAPLFLLGAIWWFCSRRTSDPANDPQEPTSHS